MFADVILPLPLAGAFTYRVPAEMQPHIGTGYRVVVPFGNRKHYTGIVKTLRESFDAKHLIKEIHSLIDDCPIVTDSQLQMWEWISFYYMCPLGEVFKAALPSALKPGDSKQGYVPKTENRVRLHPDFSFDEAQKIIGSAQKQRKLFDAVCNIFSEKEVPDISRKELLQLTGFSSAVLNELIAKNVLKQFRSDVSRIESDVTATRASYPLNAPQQTAFDEINALFATKNTVLLHGVTSGGKTEIYIHLIQQQTREGRQTLYLVPEIALTTQLTQRLQAVFGNRLGVYHSKINDNERAEIWKKMLSDAPYEVVIGVRSSLFLPFRNLGLVIVDEEHETSYKQQEPAPRYHARDTAVMLAHISGAKTLLGSATPSVESYFNARNGKYGLVLLTQRFEAVQLPEILFENTHELQRKKKMKSVLAPVLIAKITETLAQGRQVILFRNRRGFAPVLECKNCGYTPKCRRCDVPLTFHKADNTLKCHYCNATYRVLQHCPVCNEESVQELGTGTEKLEEAVAALFPDAAIARMDTDTTRGKNTYEKIISDFQTGKVQILIGTQMLSKGLDFDNVSLVGIIAADGMLNHPDFRSHERGFQLMTQAAGRAGRKNRQGTVIIQTADPEQPIYRFIAQNDFAAFFEMQLAERKLFHYPPFTRLISIVIKDKNEARAQSAADFLATTLHRRLAHRVLGPNKPVVSKIQLFHIREILLKLEIGLSPQHIRDVLKDAERELRDNPNFKYVVVYFDVDRC